MVDFVDAFLFHRRSATATNNPPDNHFTGHAHLSVAASPVVRPTHHSNSIATLILCLSLPPPVQSRKPKPAPKSLAQMGFPYSANYPARKTYRVYPFHPLNFPACPLAPPPPSVFLPGPKKLPFSSRLVGRTNQHPRALSHPLPSPPARAWIAIPVANHGIDIFSAMVPIEDNEWGGQAFFSQGSVHDMKIPACESRQIS